ncbi:MAG: ACT domain-containing protein [Coriobacteriia bacterium]|nr:ACT domain-containing protein [Coriobacteriia bacterium]
MSRVELRNEILFKAPTRVGLLSDVAEALHGAGVNVLAIGAYDKGDVGEFLLVTDNNKAAFAALDGMGGTLDLLPVVVAWVDNAPGELARVARRLADNGITVAQIHASTTDAPTAMLVIRADCELDVIKLLEGV